jgi:hypothetical protein
MTARLSILTLIVVLTFAVRAVQSHTSDGASVSAAALAGALATVLAAGFERFARGLFHSDDLRDSIQISFYIFLALVMALYVIIDTAFGIDVFSHMPGGRIVWDGAAAGLISVPVLALKIFGWDQLRPTRPHIFHVVMMVVFCVLVTCVIAATPNALFQAGLDRLAGLGGAT